MCKKDYSQNPSINIWENNKYLKSIADNSKIVYNEITMDTASANVTNTIPRNVTITVSTNFHRKVRYKMDSYILHTVLLVILLLLFAIIMQGTGQN